MVQTHIKAIQALEKITSDEGSLVVAALQFAHLNRSLFYRFVEEQGHKYIMDYMENEDHNHLRRTLTELFHDDYGDETDSTEEYRKALYKTINNGKLFFAMTKNNPDDIKRVEENSNCEFQEWAE